MLSRKEGTMKTISSSIVVIDRGDKFQVFDGSVENAAIDILPTQFLVSKARVIKKDNNNPWINLEDKGLYRASYRITGDIDQNGKLVETDDTEMIVPNGQETFASVPGKKVAKKVIKFLESGKPGYVRIVAPLYGSNASFDIKIPCRK